MHAQPSRRRDSLLEAHSQRSFHRGATSLFRAGYIDGSPTTSSTGTLKDAEAARGWKPNWVCGSDRLSHAETKKAKEREDHNLDMHIKAGEQREEEPRQAEEEPKQEGPGELIVQ